MEEEEDDDALPLAALADCLEPFPVEPDSVALPAALLV